MAGLTRAILGGPAALRTPRPRPPRIGRDDMEKVTGTCSVDGCCRKHNSRGFCNMHYTRWRNTGDPNMVRKSGRRPRPVAERLAAKAEPADSGCLLWTGYRMANGYASIWVFERQEKQLVHRVAWEVENGEIPDGLHVHHLCGNRSCINTAHLTLITLSEHSSVHAGEQERSRAGRFIGKRAA